LNAVNVFFFDQESVFEELVICTVQFKDRSSLHREANLYQTGGQVVFSKIRWVFISKSKGCEFFTV